MKKNPNVRVIRDDNGRPVAELYRSTETRDGARRACWRYRVIGANGERMAPSQGYNGGPGAALAGLYDLRDRMNDLPATVTEVITSDETFSLE